MRLATFIHDGQPRLGALDPDNDTLTDLSRAAPDLPGDMNALIALGADGLAAVQKAVAAAGDDSRLSLDAVTLCAPNWPPVRESATAEVTGSWAELRTDAFLRAFARHAEVPVVNMESNTEHPCQELADRLTLVESWASHRGRNMSLPMPGTPSRFPWRRLTRSSSAPPVSA